MTKDGFPRPPGRRWEVGREGGADPSPSASRRRVLLVGFGHVGRALARRLVELGHESGDLPWRVVALVDSRGTVWEESGVDLPEALATKESTGRLSGPAWHPWSAVEAIRRVRPEVVVEVSVSHSEHGEPGTAHVLAALESGADVVASNKGPFALRYEEILWAASRTGRQVRFGTTVGGIVPVLETLVERLPGAEVGEVAAVLNGTSQYILSRLAEGISFAAAVEEAKARGFTEPDPSWDLEGHDAALKAAIVHNCVFAPAISASDVGREGLRPEVRERLDRARKAGKTLVQIARIRPGSARVQLEEVPQTSVWASAGASNTVEIRTRHAGVLLLQGAGAGTSETAAGILADLASLASHDGRASTPPEGGPGWAAGLVWPPSPGRPPVVAPLPVVGPSTARDEAVGTRAPLEVRGW